MASRGFLIESKGSWIAGLALAATVGCHGGDGGGGGGADGGMSPDAGPACVDVDGDQHGANCVAGADCDDADADNWSSCGTCVDADGDRAFTGCDAYVQHAGPDCDDADPARNPSNLELPDDGRDNDCDGSDRTAASLTVGVFVADVATCSDSVAGRGSRAIPFCTLPAAVAQHPAGDFYVAEGTYPASSLAFSGDVRIFGGYDGTTWQRDVQSRTTEIALSATARGDLVTFADADEVLIDGVVVSGTSFTGGAQREFVLSGTVNGRFELWRSTVVADGLLGTVRIEGGTTGSPEARLVQTVLRCEDAATNSWNALECVLAEQLTRVELAYSSLSAETVGRSVHVATFNTCDTVAMLNDTLWADTSMGSTRVVRANGGDRLEVVDTSIFARSASNSYGGVFEVGGVGDLVFVNVATESSSAETVWLFDYGTSLGRLTARGNVFHETLTPATADWAWRTTVGNPMTVFHTVAEFEACTDDCPDVDGNAEHDPAFANAALGDFSIGSTSPLVDSGVDPTSFSTVAGVAFSFSAPRPSGAGWDVGAYEFGAP